MPPTQDFSFLALSPDSDSDVSLTPSLLSASSVVPSPDSQLLNSFDPVAALSGNPALLASLMSAIANMTPEQQEQMFSSVYGAAVDHASASASASPPAESAFIQFNTQNTAFAEGAGALPNWLELSLLSGNSPSQSHSSVEPSPQSAPISATDALISMLLTQNTQTTAFPTFTQQPVATSTVDPLSALLASASALPPPPASLPPPPTASTTSSRPVPEIAALISQVYGDRTTPAIQNIPNILEIVQSALSKKDVAETSSGKESRQRKHDEMEHDGSGSDSGVAASSKSTKRRKALTEEEKEEKQRERMLRNRAAAQESRDKKKRYVENLESLTEELKSQNTLLQARLRHSESQNRLLESRLEALATHFVAHMTARTNSNLPISPPISSHSPIDVPHTDSAAVDPQSARVSATTQPRPPSVSPNMDAGTDGVGSVASKHPYAFGDADSFVIPSFVESRGVSARKSSTLHSTLTSPQRTLWTSSWSTSSTPSTVSLASKPISRRFSEVVVKEEDVGVPSVSPDNTRDLAVVSATIVHGVLLWMVDVTAGGVAGRWRGRPGAGSGARWGYTGTPGGGGVQPLLRRKSWGAGLRMGGGVERKALWLNSGSTTASASA